MAHDEWDISGEMDAERLRSALYQANARIGQLTHRNDALVQTVFDATEATLLAMSKRKMILPPEYTGERKGRAEVALWHLTDWQGAKITTTYNSEVMRRRVKEYEKSAAKITNIQRAHHPVKDVVVCYGGDMGEGMFNFPSQPFETDRTLFGQMCEVSTLISENLLYAASLYENVWVFAEWGNHGRIGSKRSAIVKNDNFDRMIYWQAYLMTRHEPRIHWPAIDKYEDFFPEDIQYIKVGNYRALLIHGDEVGRNGSASPNTMKAAGDRWASGAYRAPFSDIYMGHFHTHSEMPLANGLGAIYQTGSTESDNRYARDSMGSSALPSQRLHFIDTRDGRVTAQHKIWLTV